MTNGYIERLRSMAALPNPHIEAQKQGPGSVSPEAIAAVTDCRSYTQNDAVQRKMVWFENADDDQLRFICDWHAPGITRQQLLAACRNRWPCGFYYEIEGPL